MNSKEFLDAAKGSFKIEGLVVTFDGKYLIKDVIKKAVAEMVADSSNPYDDMVWKFLEPLIDAQLDAQKK